MKSLFRSTNKLPGLLSIAVLTARQPDPEFLSRLNSALDASGLAPEVLISTSPTALAAYSPHGLTFLLPCENTDRQVEATATAIRSALAQSGTPYQVLYGDVNERLSQALRLIDSALLQTSSPRRASTDDSERSTRAWVWICDKCSDPECEHKLLTDLLANRPLKAVAPTTEY